MPAQLVTVIEKGRAVVDRSGARRKGSRRTSQTLPGRPAPVR